MINKKQAIEILNAGLASGADFSEIYFECRTSKVYSIENGKVNAATNSTISGVGIRLLKEFQSVYGYTNDISKNSLLNLAQSLANSFNGKRLKTVDSLKQKSVRNKHPYLNSYNDVPTATIIEYLKKGDNAIRNFDEHIVKSLVSFSISMVSVVIFNSDGLIIKDYKERGRAGFSAVAQKDGRIESAFEGPGATSGFEYFLNEIDPIKVGTSIAKSAVLMLDAKDCPSGKMPVVIGNGFGGVLFHEACGHPLEGTSVSKNLSCFAGKLGKQIASPLVTAIDDGTIENGWGSNNIDDEGNKTEKNVLIKNGILVNYLVDNFTGRRMGMKGNGACRRQSYKYEPTSRMSNTYIANGKSTPEEIIASTKLGLYAKSLGGGSVNPATGEFNFGCNEAYIIRDGKICEPVSGASLIGTGAEVLMKIDMVGNDCKRAQGMCGSCSGSIPVDVGQPTLRVSEITVGGKGGELK